MEILFLSSLMNWHEDFGKEIGRPLGPATKDGYAYHRVFEHCTVDINVETKTSSIEWGQNNIFYENVVLNGTATQSSTDYEGVPERAIDGNTNGDYNDDSVTHTAFEDQPWWQVDLGAPYAIDEIQVWGRTDDCCKGRLSNYDVYILDCRNNVVWSNYQASYPDPSVSLDPEWARGRFVTIQLQAANQALSLAEVRVLSENPAGYCGDLTLDGKVNLADYAELSANWQSGYSMDTLLHIINDWLSGLEEYQLTVNSGTGSGDYTAGTVVSISADAPPTGYEFAGWAGDVAYVADAGDPTTTVTMPTKNIDLTATYSVQETTISWQPAVAVFSASDVSTDGILVEAVNACGDAIAAAGFTENPIVNGVQFMADPDLLDGNHSTSDFCTSLPEGEYDQLVSTLDYFGSPTSIEVGHDLLEVGADYMIQIWYVDERPNYDSRTMQYADEDGGDPSGAVNDQYVIGTFTADGATLFIAITATGTDDPHINAYQIRKLSE